MQTRWVYLLGFCWEFPCSGQQCHNKLTAQWSAILHSHSFPSNSSWAQPSHSSRHKAHPMHVADQWSHCHLCSSLPCSQRCSHTLPPLVPFTTMSQSCWLQRLNSRFKRIISLELDTLSKIFLPIYHTRADSSMSTLPACLWKAMITSPKSQARECTDSWLIRSCPVW